MYQFVKRETLGETVPNQRFAAPSSNAVFNWWELAFPQPAYRLCVARIKAITDQDRFSCQLFDRNNNLKPGELDIDLRDWTQVWRGFPSTIDLPGPLSAPVDPVKNCTLLCVSEAALDKAGWSVGEIGTFSKWPRGEDLVTEAKQLRDFVRQIFNQVPGDAIKHVPGYTEIKHQLGL
jgi:hypothetical protein